MENAITIDQSDRAYFSMIPNIIGDLQLTPYDIALYWAIKRVAGENSYCWKTVRTLAKELRMSTGSVTKARRALARKRRELGGKSLITVTAGDGGVQVITVIDIWPENMQSHVTSPNGSPKEDADPNRAPDAQQNPNCAPDAQPVSPGAHACAPGAQKKINSKKRRTLSRVRESREVVFPISNSFSDYQKSALRCWQEHLEAAGHGFKTVAAWESFLRRYAEPLAAAGTLVSAIEVGMALGNRRLDPDIPVPEAAPEKKEKAAPLPAEEQAELLAIVREEHPNARAQWADVPPAVQQKAIEERERRKKERTTNHE